MSKLNLLLQLVSKLILLLQLVSRHNWFSKGVIDWGGARFHKKLSWIIKKLVSLWKMIQVWLCAPKWISHEFLVYLKIIQNSFFLAHNHPPIMNWGGARKLFKISDTFKPDHISLPKMFFNVFKSIEIQNLKGFDILDQGRECDLNRKSDKKWSFLDSIIGSHICAKWFDLTSCTY